MAVLRTLRRGDLPSLVRFVNKLVAEKRVNPTLGITLDKRVTSETEKGYLSKMLKGLKRGDVISVVAQVRGEIVGNCEITRRTFSGELHHTGTLGIAILDGCRDVGLGGRMLQILLMEARRAGIRVVELEVFSVNAAARRLYERLGFKEVGVVPRKVLRKGKYFDSVAMYADLGTDKSTG
ncbi:MAG: GNAT family N-acetyltransferase [Nitrososphaerales archaeon]|nr:GNAT family N-acetyltransferase [Nitrososphaerales archaeon]